MNRAEIERLAGAMVKLRRDWHFASLVTYLTTHAADVPLWDAGRALVWIALEPGLNPGEYVNDSPALFAKPGPWWTSQTPPRTEAETPIPQTGCTLHGVRSLPCDQCRRDAANVADPAHVAAILDRHGIKRSGGRTPALTEPTAITGPPERMAKLTDDQINTERNRQLAALEAITEEES